jgi:hypothetical protein
LRCIQCASAAGADAGSGKSQSDGQNAGDFHPSQHPLNNWNSCCAFVPWTAHFLVYRQHRESHAFHSAETALLRFNAVGLDSPFEKGPPILPAWNGPVDACFYDNRRCSPMMPRDLPKISTTFECTTVTKARLALGGTPPAIRLASGRICPSGLGDTQKNGIATKSRAKTHCNGSL